MFCWFGSSKGQCPSFLVPEGVKVCGRGEHMKTRKKVSVVPCGGWLCLLRPLQHFKVLMPGSVVEADEGVGLMPLKAHSQHADMTPPHNTA